MNDLRTLPYSLSYKTFKKKGVSDGRLKDGRLKTHINFTSSYMLTKITVKFFKDTKPLRISLAGQ